MSIAGHGYGDFGGPFPAIVERARLDKEWQEALTRFGYRRVKHAYARQMRKSPKDSPERSEADAVASTTGRPWSSSAPG